MWLDLHVKPTDTIISNATFTHDGDSRDLPIAVISRLKLLTRLCVALFYEFYRLIGLADNSPPYRGSLPVV